MIPKLVLLILTTFCSFVHADKYARKESPLKYSYAIGARTFVDQDLFTYEDLVALIQNKNLRSVEEVLPELKKAHPELFDRFVLMYRSKSLQRASFDLPRVIMFDSSARLFVTFNGDQTDTTGFKKLEVIQFRGDTRRFELREISFDSGSGAVFSEANPSKCLKCHQSPDRKNIDPRPNWEPYNVWPGAYGSENGDFTVLSEPDRKKYAKEDRIHVDDQAQEKVKLTRFLNEVRPAHPRYKHLGSEDFLAKVPAPEADLELVGAFTKHLTDLVAYPAARRVVRIMQEEWKDEWRYLKPVIEGAVRCERLFIPSDKIDWFKKRLPNEFIVSTRREGFVIPTEEERRRDYLLEIGKDKNLSQREVARRTEERLEKDRVFYAQERMRISKSIWTIYEPLGIRTEDWSMDFQTQGRFAFTERMGVPSHIRRMYMDALGLKESSPRSDREVCHQLIDESRQSIEKMWQSPLMQKIERRQLEKTQPKAPLIQRCVSCHVDEASYTDIPLIPFDKEDLLKAELIRLGPSGKTLLEDIKFRLSDHATLETQMPRGLGRPSREQRQELIRYLEQLVATP